MVGFAFAKQSIKLNIIMVKIKYFCVLKWTIKIKNSAKICNIDSLGVSCRVINILVFTGFYIPSDSGEKVAMGITTLLSMTVFLMLVTEAMPPTSDSLPLIGESVIMMPYRLWNDWPLFFYIFGWPSDQRDNKQEFDQGVRMRVRMRMRIYLTPWAK